ncbi:MAG TPA: hypothetical protein P5560_03755 [Thermotogota bacterium]|nr:hypothetical protein [Thermotogota bacterium]HRW92045.1 hypothetical protein [Thermotogota bacterium]
MKAPNRTFFLFLSVLLFVACLSVAASPSETPPSSPTKSLSRWPVRFDFLGGEFFLVQIPLTIGLPIDWGIGFTQQAPLGGIYAYADEKRYKKVLFLNQLIEQRQVKLFIGISNKLLFEAKWNHYLNQSVDVSWVPIANRYTDRANLLSEYEIRFIGTAQNPSSSAKGYVKIGLAAYEFNAIGNYDFSPWQLQGQLEAELKLFEYEPFGIALGEFCGVMGGLPLAKPTDFFSPRIGLGYSFSTKSLGIAFFFHERWEWNKSRVWIHAGMVFGLNQRATWSLRGEWEHPDQHAFLFSLSPKHFYLGGRWIAQFPSLSP